MRSRVLFTFLCVAGCASAPPASQLVVVVDTDLADATSLDAHVLGSTGTSQDALFTIDGTGSIPATLGLVAEDGFLGPVVISVDARGASGVIVNQTLRTSFVAGETRELRLFLAEACRGVACSGDSTCVGGRCFPSDIPSSELPTWTGRTDRIDAGDSIERDGGVPIDLDGATPDARMPADASVPTTIYTALSAGRAHTCAIDDEGNAYCWGENELGQIGVGTADAPVARRLIAIDDATAIAAGGAHTCAIRAGGVVSCWGANVSGQLGGGFTSPQEAPTPVMGLSGATHLCAGANHSCAVLNDGTVRCWGEGDRYQLGDRMMTDYSSRPITAVSVTGVSEIRCGEHRTCVRQGTTMRCWGRNDVGQIGDGTADDHPAATAPAATLAAAIIATGRSHSCVVAATGVFCFGANAAGQLGSGATSVSENVPTRVMGVTTAQGIATGGAHSCAVVGGEVSCWGEGSRGQLGRGMTLDSASPEAVAGVAGAMASLALGEEHTCVLLGWGEILCWGANGSGQLGDGTTGDRSMATLILAPAP